MSARGTVQVVITADASSLSAGLKRVEKRLRIYFLLARVAMYRAGQQFKLAGARLRKSLGDDRLDIQIVTDSDGVCRVHTRRLGGWSFPDDSDEATR